MEEKWLEFELEYDVFADLAANTLNNLKEQYYIQEVMVFNIRPGVVHLLVLVSEKGQEGTFFFEEADVSLPKITNIWTG